MPNNSMAIRACFAEWRMVKTRKVLALIFEVPLEQQAEVLTILGAPMPDSEIWCGIARLKHVEQPTLPAPAGRTTASERGKLAYTNGTVGERARTRASLLPKDPRFVRWVASQLGGAVELITDEISAQFIRDTCCDGWSRAMIADDSLCLHRFLAMESSYVADTNQMAELR